MFNHDCLIRVKTIKATLCDFVKGGLFRLIHVTGLKANLSLIKEGILQGVLHSPLTLDLNIWSRRGLANETFLDFIFSCSCSLPSPLGYRSNRSTISALQNETTITAICFPRSTKWFGMHDRNAKNF